MAYCVVSFGPHVPSVRLGTVPAGQHVPQDVTWVGSQHAPSGVITWLLLVQGATHLLPTRTSPLGHGIPVNGIGQIEAVGLTIDLTGGTAASPVESQMQTSANGPDAAAACVVCPGPRLGHWQ